MYRVPARPSRPPPPPVNPPRDLLDHAHWLLDHYPLGVAFVAAVIQIASAFVLALVLAKLL